MVVKHFIFWIVLAVGIVGCAIVDSPEVTKIALLSSFEGRYREIGYDALYAARLAINDSGRDDLNLLAIDNGGSIETANARAEAIALDESIAVVLVIGIHSTNEAVLEALNKPTIIVGHWGTTPTSNSIMLAHPDIDMRLANNPADSSEALALKQVPKINPEFEDITLFSSATFADDIFIERYLASDLFVSEPALYTSLVYDATAIAIEHITTSTPLNNISYDGINGAFAFDDAGYWINAALYRYGYNADGELVLLD